jgi:F-type H+-transporting ATPase subunit epsilon
MATATSSTYPATVVTPDGIAFEGDVQKLIVTGGGGQVAFLARHTPLVADLKVGHARVELPDGSWKTWATGQGFVQVHDSTATAVVEDAVSVDDIDTAEVEAWLVPAREELAKLEAEATALPDRAEIEAGPDPAAVFRKDLAAVQRRVAWGEHLLELQANVPGASH